MKYLIYLKFAYRSFVTDEILGEYFICLELGITYQTIDNTVCDHLSIFICKYRSSLVYTW